MMNGIVVFDSYSWDTKKARELFVENLILKIDPQG